jgi:hypothetical protein
VSSEMTLPTHNKWQQRSLEVCVLHNDLEPSLYPSLRQNRSVSCCNHLLQTVQFCLLNSYNEYSIKLGVKNCVILQVYGVEVIVSDKTLVSLAGGYVMLCLVTVVLILLHIVVYLCR